METGITARQAGTSMQLHKPTPSLSAKKTILAWLTKCAARRGAPVEPISMAIYAEDLSICDPRDLEEVLDIFGRRAPEDYRQLWPAVGTFLQMVEELQKSRRPDPSVAAGVRWMAYLEAVRAEKVLAPAEEPTDALEQVLKADNPHYGKDEVAANRAASLAAQAIPLSEVTA